MTATEKSIEEQIDRLPWIFLSRQLSGIFVRLGAYENDNPTINKFD
jgi:hypothetical protein